MTNTTKQGLIERLMQDISEDAMPAGVFSEKTEVLGLNYIRGALERHLGSNHPEPEVSEEVVEAVAYAIYEAGRRWYPEKQKWEDISPAQSNISQEHYRFMARDAIAAYRKATGAV